MTSDPVQRSTLETLDAFKHSCDLLLDQARRSVRILAPHLDLALLSREPVARALTQLSKAGRLAETRILFADSLLATKHSHRLVELSRRLPSSIKLKQLPIDIRDQQEAWIIADNTALIWRSHHERYADGIWDQHNTEKAPQLCRQFDEWWDIAQPDPELRRLNL
jgi:hypothetical protein